MGNPRSKENIDIRQIWWEGNNLHIITELDKHIVFKNAYFVDYQPSEEKDGLVVTHNFTFRSDNV
jgi:hypothetical protein